MTNKEKFIEIFGVNPDFEVGCFSFKCYGVKCDDCTFKPSFKGAWNREYKEPKIKEPMKIKVGDKVRITDDMEQYDTYNALFNKSNLSKEVISNFNRGVDVNIYESYTVLEILEHENFDDVYIAVIQNNFDEVYLIGVDGLEVVK